MFLFWAYWLIALSVGILALRELFREADWRRQLSAAVVLIPIIMRVFLFK